MVGEGEGKGAREWWLLMESGKKEKKNQTNRTSRAVTEQWKREQCQTQTQLPQSNGETTCVKGGITKHPEDTTR